MLIGSPLLIESHFFDIPWPKCTATKTVLKDHLPLAASFVFPLGDPFGHLKLPLMVCFCFLFFAVLSDFLIENELSISFMG